MDTNADQLLLRTKWFLRMKITFCALFMILLVPWYKSKSASIEESCGDSNSKDC